MRKKQTKSFPPPKKLTVFAPHLSACRCGHGTSQWEAMLNSLAKLVAKRSMKIRGGRSSCYENEWVKWVKRNKKNPLRKAKNVHTPLETLLHLSFFGYPKKNLRRISHFIPFSSIFFLLPIKLNDFSNSRANKRHFENFDQILLTVTLG